jgi:hypothetical protein
VIAQLVAAAALAAAPTPLLDAPRAQDVAVAGDEVIVTRPGESGRLRVDAVAVDGSGVRPLLVTPRLGVLWSSSGQVFASPQQIAVLATSETPLEDDGFSRIRKRLYIGPRTGPLQLVASVGGANVPREWTPFGAAVDGDRVLVSEVRQKPIQKARLRLFEPGAAPRLLAWGERALPPLALAGEHVAYIRDSGSAFRLVVADLESGTRQVSVKVTDPTEFDLAADGSVVAEGTFGLVTAAPGRRPRLVRGSDLLLAGRFAGTRIAATAFNANAAFRPVVLDRGARAPRPVGVFTQDLRALDADAAGVGWIANGCVLYAPVDAAAPAEPPAGPCPRTEIQFTEHDLTLRGRRLRVDVDCVAAPAGGCDGTVTLRIGGMAGRAGFHLRSGTHRVVTVRIPRRAARIVRRRVHRFGTAALRLDWRVPDARASLDFGLFFVNKLS